MSKNRLIDKSEGEGKGEITQEQAAVDVLRGYLCDGSSQDRCDRCGWPLADDESRGCVVGNCSERSQSVVNYRRPEREQKARAAIRMVLAAYDEQKRLADGLRQRAEAAEALSKRAVADQQRLFRCSLCEREFDTMPSDRMHTVHGRYPTKGGDYIDVDGECGPVYEVTNG